MGFWDYFIYRVYATFADVPPDMQNGAKSASRIVDAAYVKGLLELPRLSGQSIATLAFLNPPSAGPAAIAESKRRKPPLLPLAPLTRVPAGAGPIVLFLSSLYLDDPAIRGKSKNELFFLAWATATYARLPPNTVGSFPSYLYSCLLAPPSGFEVKDYPDPKSPMPPTDFPESKRSSAATAGLLAQGKHREFIDACLWLPGYPDRVSIYLSFYAQLGIRDIHAVQNWFGTYPYEPILHELENGYKSFISMC